MKASRLKPEPDELIREFLVHQLTQVYTNNEIKTLYHSHREKWNINRHTSAGYLFDIIAEYGLLKPIRLKFNNQAFELNVSNSATIWEILYKTATDLYFSHHAAAYLHGLIATEPTHIYLTDQQRPSLSPGTYEMTQNSIDAAFSKPQRKSGNNAVYNKYQITIVVSKLPYSPPTQQLKKDHLELTATTIEHTLIDIAVRPKYCNGPKTVLDIYRNAKSKADPVKLISVLKKMKHIYPYHQAIGFYMQQAGYHPAAYEPLQKKFMKFDFYLDYEMTEPDYSSEWKLYYPKGL